MSCQVLVAWTWNQLAHEGGMFAAWLLVTLCLAYFAGRAINGLLTREDKLKYHGMATGLARNQKSVPSRQLRFSTLDLLVAITLVAVLAGLVTGMANQNRDGIPDLRLRQEVEREIEKAKQRGI
jgi:hypothetical protein